MEYVLGASDLYDDSNYTSNLLNDTTDSQLLNYTSCSGSDNSTSCAWNHTTPTLGGKVYWALVMIPLPLVAVVGNLLVILSVYKERNLQSATNYFIVSLAFADLLVAAVVMPFAVYVLNSSSIHNGINNGKVPNDSIYGPNRKPSIIDETRAWVTYAAFAPKDSINHRDVSFLGFIIKQVNVDWELSETLCDFYIALDVTCSTASIFNLVAISVDRFIAVTRPIQYSKHRSGKRVFLTICFVWLVSAAIGSPIVLGLNTSPERSPHLCVFYSSDFIIYSSLSSFYIPCLVMVCLYYSIFRAIRERARKHIGGGGGGVVIENASRKKNSKNDTKPPAGISYIKTLSPVVEGDETSQMYHSDNGDDDDEESPMTEKEDCQVISNVAVSSFVDGTQTSKANGSPATPLEDGEKGKAAKKVNRFKLAKPEKKKREKNTARRERKATKTLAIVLGVFLICWVPFFTCNILDAICIKLQSDTWRPGVTVFLLTTWLGYLNSCVNPVIYTIFNLEFRKAFKKLLLEPCK